MAAVGARDSRGCACPPYPGPSRRAAPADLTASPRAPCGLADPPASPPRGFPGPDARRGPVHLDGRSPPGRAVRVEAQNRFSRVSEDTEVVWWCLVAFWAPFGVP